MAPYDDPQTSVDRPPGGVPDEVVIAAQAERVAPGPAARLSELLLQQEIAARPADRQLDEAAQRSVAAFERDVEELNQRMRVELDGLNDRWQADGPRRPPVRDSDLLHVYGPDTEGSGDPSFYKFGWFHTGALGHARADHRTGQFWATDYTIGPASFTVAQIGVQLRPRLSRCKLSVRPYLRWTGSDVLKHRVHDHGVSEQRRAWAMGSVGIAVESWNEAGGGHFSDREHWVTPNLWDRSEVNPTSARDYDGVATSSSGLEVETFASGSRYYTIWVTCRVGVSADHGFAVSTYATSSISCHLPFLVVEEIPLS